MARGFEFRDKTLLNYKGEEKDRKSALREKAAYAATEKENKGCIAQIAEFFGVEDISQLEAREKSDYVENEWRPVSHADAVGNIYLILKSGIKKSYRPWWPLDSVRSTLEYRVALAAGKKKTSKKK